MLMYNYSAYGMGIHSALPLPELKASKARADVEIQIHRLTNLPIEDKTTYHYSWASEQGVYLYWKDVATFLVQDGRKIIIDPVSGVEEKRLRLFLLGAALSVILHQRGYLVFHASAVAINGAVAIFAGNKGWGKSTMAAALNRNGHNFVADDVVAVDIKNKDVYTVLPAFPQIKLWSDAISSMGDDPAEFSTVSSLVDKRIYNLVDSFLDRSLPLKHIYVLGVSDKTVPEICPVKAQKALIYLIAQTYYARWGKQTFTQDSASNLLACTEIIKKIPVYHLTRPRSLELLPDIVRLLEEHMLGTEIN